jgi:hypothetical protein
LALRYKHIASFLSTSGNKFTRYFSYVGLGLGILLLLSCLQLFINLQQLLGNDNPRKSGYDYIAITKEITNESMGQPDKNLFNSREIKEIESQPFVDGVTPLIANRFQVELSAGNIIPFSTSLFLESLDNNFLDTIPPNFTWKEGEEFLPLIVSSDFLQMYNVFAPGYGLPQVSESTASRILVYITCSGKNGEQQTFRGSIVAFSDRINSIIVPKVFLEWANKKFGNSNEVKAARLYIKTKDANNPEFLHFLDQHSYRVNKDKVKFGRVKSILQLVVSGLGVFGLLVVVLALMLFSFYLQLMIAKSKDSLVLLMTLGYAPKWLTKTVAGRWVPIYTGIIVSALLLLSILQWLFYKLTSTMETKITPFIHWSALLVAIVLIGLTAYSNYRMIKKQLYSLD